MEVGVSLPRVLRRIRQVREERYGLFSGFFRGFGDDTEGMDESKVLRLFSVALCAGAAAIAMPLGALKLEQLHVEVKSVRRNNRRRLDLEDAFELEQGDVLVLLGNSEQLARAETRILNGQG
jgi:CPA2 family monovalent cation:H+ antiporter-2